MSSIKWEVDPDHSSVEFSVAHLMINKIKGAFEHFEAILSFDPNDVTTMGIQASIEANSITTRQRQRDEHLRSEDFFHAAKYPVITFQSTSCVLAGERQYELAGNLTLHGVTKPVTFHTVFEGFNQDPRGRERVGFHSTARIERNEFGLTFNSPLETGGIVVGNEVSIELYIEAIKVI
ncbi:polyisoprenoid-binding protein [Paenibacillus sp. JNUCC31]|uniref:YceI family protein n=1 Tax=Paenibacillus sp. JNUCC-31 TaxID=2777983 RepID=UPI00177E16C1|nr:YceI family protein [Paenibacillus sp. JNUCC-31]QOS81900.1 polyisoprenoid-binding protein [Paenibacillus sp. JNUCC-31]